MTLKENTSMEAFLDDYGKIIVYVSHRFYNGKCDQFTLIEQGVFSSTCQIREVVSKENYTQYTLIGPADLVMGKEYWVLEDHGHRAVLQARHIVQTTRFDEEYAYEGMDLGASCSQNGTLFVLWAPTAIDVKVEIQRQDQVFCVPMKKTEKGTFRVFVEGDFDGGAYVYLVKVNGEVHQTVDPYAISSLANGRRSGLVNLQRISTLTHRECLKPLTSFTDATIYEISVRDFTHAKTSGTSTHGKFLSLCQEKTTFQNVETSLDYLKSLGISHIQLMPVADFATVEEEYPDLVYNWGYDPLQYNCPEGSYSSNPNDPRVRVMELQQLVSCMHAKGLRVNMDVVYNHHYDIRLSAFDACVPYYYFRVGSEGYLSNGSFCGNDTDSTKRMMRKYMVDSILNWIKIYDVDGFRFDLMGIHDIDTMNLIVQQGRNAKPDLMVYGEGWNLPTALDEGLKACQSNNVKMPQVSHFNDVFRDVVKGKTSEYDVRAKGYLTGNLYQAYEMRSCLIAHSSAHKDCYKIYQQPYQSINYVECHDNATGWDKLKDCCKEEIREIRIKRQKMMIAAIFVSQGIPFLQSGQEFCRTKYGIHNSYNKPDNINEINWERRNSLMDVVEFTKDCIRLRSLIPAFRFSTTLEIEQHVQFEVRESNVLLYELVDVQAYGGYETIRVYFNPSDQVEYIDLKEYYDQLFNEAGLLCPTIPVQNLAVNPYTIVVVAKK